MSGNAYNASHYLEWLLTVRAADKDDATRKLLVDFFSQGMLLASQQNKPPKEFYEWLKEHARSELAPTIDSGAPEAR